MSKLLKQLVQVLDENGVQIKKLNIEEDALNGEHSIEVNKEIVIVDRGGSYALYTEDASLNKTFYSSLTEALEVVSYYLGSRVKEGAILYSSTGIRKYKVIKNVGKDLYNLLEVPHNKLLFSECKGLDYIQEQVDDGVYHAK